MNRLLPGSYSNHLDLSVGPQWKLGPNSGTKASCGGASDCHDLRHTAATLLLGQGVHPKIASEMLRHSTVAITLDLYSHVTESMQRKAAGAMDTLLAGDRQAGS